MMKAFKVTLGIFAAIFVFNVAILGLYLAYMARVSKEDIFLAVFFAVACIVAILDYRRNPGNFWRRLWNYLTTPGIQP